MNSGTIQDRRVFLKQLSARANLLCPLTAERAKLGIAEAERNLNQENTDKLNALVLKAANNAEAMAELTQLRITAVDNFLLPASNALSFFSGVSLGPNVMPIIQNNSRQEILISYLGQDGKPRMSQAVKEQQNFQIQMKPIWTEDFEYVIKDLLRGDVSGAAKANIDMTFDMAAKIDKLAWPYIKNLIGNFTTTGKKSGRTFVPHSYINIKNLPASNLLTPGTGNTTTSGLRKICFDIVLKYCAAWGNAFQDKGMMKPVALYVPSGEALGLVDEITFTSFGNSVVEQIFEGGWKLNYGGVDWVIVADNTLDPDEGRAYIRTNMEIGEAFTKPDWDQTIEDVTTMELRKQNKGKVTMGKAIGFGTPLPWAPRVIGLQYHTAR